MHFNISFFVTIGIATTERSSCLKRVAFSSTNFENILTWETEADILPGTVFDVQYKQYVKFASFGDLVGFMATFLREEGHERKANVAVSAACFAVTEMVLLRQELSKR